MAKRQQKGELSKMQHAVSGYSGLCWWEPAVVHFEHTVSML